MPQPTKIVVHFDDGSTFDIDAATTSSVFIGESNAVKCGHRPPYKTPPGNGNPGTLSASTSTVDDGSSAAASTMGGSCYYINGVVYCP